MSRRRADGWPAPAIIAGMGAVCLINRDYSNAVLIFVIALAAVIEMLPDPNCCQDCGQGRQPCKRRGTDR